MAEPEPSKETLTQIRKLLIGARALIHRGWVKGHSAVVNSRDVTCYCLSGAIRESRVRLDIHERYNAETFLRRYTPDHGITSFNDDPKTTKQDVLDALDRAIAATKA